MHRESLTSVLAHWLFAVTLLCICIFSYHIAMRYNKTDRDSIWGVLPSTFGIRQYFPNIGETISSSDLNTSHYLYIMEFVRDTSSENSLIDFMFVTSDTCSCFAN